MQVGSCRCGCLRCRSLCWHQALAPTQAASRGLQLAGLQLAGLQLAGLQLVVGLWYFGLWLVGLVNGVCVVVAKPANNFVNGRACGRVQPAARLDELTLGGVERVVGEEAFHFASLVRLGIVVQVPHAVEERPPALQL